MVSTCSTDKSSAPGCTVYAALRTLGRAGVANLVDRYCASARRMADRLGAADGVEILNDVVLTQVLVRFRRSGEDATAADRRTSAVAAAVQEDGTCWLGTTTWHGVVAIRISISNWSTTEEDIDRSAEAILRCAATVEVPA
jgi:glutamate/tyrosine decarboxylase-like PLP-dependent enzyme